MTQIEITDLTNGSNVNQEWQGTGVFDKLMSAVNKNIEIQYQKGRITGSDYAQVYVQSLQATLQQAVEFLLRKDLIEVQVDSELKTLELKTAQLAAERNKTEAELEKQWGYSVTRDANGELILGASTGNGKVDKEITLSDKQATLLDTQEQGEQFKVDYLMPKELDQVTAQISLTGKQEDQLDEQILIAKQEVLSKTYEVEVLLPDQHTANTKQQAQLDAQIAELVDSIIRANTQLNDQLLTSEKQRVLLDTDEQAKQYEVDYLQPAQLAQLQKQVEVTEREITDKEMTSSVQRSDIIKSIELKDQQLVNLVTEDKVTAQRIVGRTQSIVNKE